MDKIYQVFVSSTFEDLQEERKEVMQALLELDCMPAGMELFPASNDDQWTLIKRVIDACDYYLLIIGVVTEAPTNMALAIRKWNLNMRWKLANRLSHSCIKNLAIFPLLNLSKIRKNGQNWTHLGDWHRKNWCAIGRHRQN